MVSIKQDFIDRNNRYEYDSRDIWEVKEVYKIGGGYHVAVINNLTGYGSAHLCTYNMDLRTIDDLKARLLQDDNIAKVKNNSINTCKIMEKRMITKPFDLELAKKISNGEYDGEIVTVGHNHKVELVYYNKDRGTFNTLGHKPQTQIIAVIHNPALIYKLSKLDHVNFIEMTKGYLKKVVSFMNKNK